MDKKLMPSQEQINHGLDGLVAKILYETDKTKENLDKMYSAMNVLERYKYNVEPYRWMYNNMKNNFKDVGGENGYNG